MREDRERGTYGFRFTESAKLPLYGLFAVGHERETDISYDWNGLTRTDGPLLLFQYTVEGEGELEIGDKKYTMDPGRAFLVEIPGAHRYRLPREEAHWEFYFILFRPSLAFPLWETIKSRLGEAPYLLPGCGPILALKGLYQDARLGRIRDPYIASSHVCRFVMELVSFASRKGQGAEDWPPSIRDAVHFVDNHYDRMIGQEQLARKLGLSKYHFLRTFVKYVGVTPVQYTNRIRIEKSAELLLQTDWSLERIAASVSYSSGSYYIKVFRKLTGQTPAQFRSGTPLQISRLFID